MKDFRINYEEMFTTLGFVLAWVLGCVIGTLGGLAVFG